MIQFFHRTLFNNQYYLSQGFRAIFLRIFCEIAVRLFKKRFYYRAIIARQKSCEKLANRRAASDEKPTPVFELLHCIVLMRGFDALPSICSFFQ